ncbi:hypothetical protein FDG2_5698 [Candidatus Protofrankia californiensis]|uniref:Uncharacterized protein n=1 Tax=Candidatus Protofrankia californiensis TaxID=1839754 RepID=A0A1C3PF26_9ACTN|nr:hypothetical protein FDG2_5698 [Candidatus Protofrankia californiensis]
MAQPRDSKGRWRKSRAGLITAVVIAALLAARHVKLDARNAYGYRNPANQRLRTRCATSHRARECLNPA